MRHQSPQSHQSTQLPHNISTEQGRSDNLIHSGSQEHNFARRDFELILGTPYLTQSTHILATLPIKPLHLQNTNQDADSVPEHADTTAFDSQNKSVVKAFQPSRALTTMKPTADKRRVLALSTDASKTDSTNHGLMAQSALEHISLTPTSSPTSGPGLHLTTFEQVQT